jgi:S1-C subfamily serine protease
MKPLSRAQQLTSFSLLAGAVLFGLVLGGGAEFASPGIAAPLAASAETVESGAGAAAADSQAITPVRLPVGLPSFADLAERALPAVVSIEAQTIERGGGGRSPHGGQDPFEFFFGPRGRQGAPQDRDREFRSDSGGSGFVVSADGYVVTNNHVIDGATKVRVRLDERSYDAEIKGADPATDWRCSRSMRAAASRSCRSATATGCASATTSWRSATLCCSTIR